MPIAPQKLTMTYLNFHRTIIIIFFTITLLIGLTIYKDYGISWDEGTSRTNGIHSYNYVFKGDHTLFTYKDKDYGVAFELPLIIIEKYLKIEDFRDIFHIRHLCTYILFFISLIVFYLLGKEYLGSWKMGLLGSLMLFLSPRIFAHSFYNSKDIPLLSFYLISIYTLFKFLNIKSKRNAFLHALICSLLIDIRIVGIVIPCITSLFVFLEFIKANERDKKRIIYSFCIYVLSLIGLTILFWPFLWPNPFSNFLQAFSNMSNFRWNSSMLYLGRYISPVRLPWHYIPIWMVITTPLLYVIHFFIGIWTCLKPIYPDRNSSFYNDQQRNHCIMLMCFFLPLYTVIVLNSVLYDSWRHMFFIYPAFLMISLNGMLYIFKFIKHKWKETGFYIPSILYVVIILFQLIVTTHFMITNHPHQNVYFNILTQNNSLLSKNKFELDYWGLSYKQALEYILTHDDNKNIIIFSPTPMAKINTNILSSTDKNRLMLVQDINKATYFIGNYRWHFEQTINRDEFHAVFFNLHNKKWYSIRLATSDILYSVEIDHVKIITVYKLNQPEILLIE